MLAVEDGKIRSCGARKNRAEIPLCHQQTIDVRERQNFILTSFEAHFSKGDIRDMLAVEDGKRVPVEQGKIVPRYLLTSSQFVLKYPKIKYGEENCR